MKPVTLSGRYVIMSVRNEAPSAQEIAAAYDQFVTPATLALWDDNIHIGYWSDPELAEADDASDAADRMTDLLTDQLRAASGTRVLDAGCGLGKPACRVAGRTGATVVGVSTSGRQVAEATARAEAAGLAAQVSFAEADYQDLPYQDGSFGAVLALESIFYSDRLTTLRSLARVLRPGGRLVLTDFFDRNGLSEPAKAAVEGFRAGMLPPFPKLAGYPALLEEAGLELLEIADITEQTAPTYRILLERLGEREPKMLDAFGETVVGGLRVMLSQCVATGEPSYLRVTARRPEA
jgi:cyclopropane fatty-acyl-phospholipid synthase-like methyltransferase